MRRLLTSAWVPAVLLAVSVNAQERPRDAPVSYPAEVAPIGGEGARANPAAGEPDSAGQMPPHSGGGMAIQRQDAGDPGRSPWSPCPIFGYSAETSGLFGAGTVYTFKTGEVPPELMARRSSLTVVGWATLKRQYAMGIAPNVYLDGERWQFESQLGAALWPNTFYPLGNDARPDDGEQYSERLFAARVTVTRQIFERVRAGVRLASVHATNVDSEPGGLLDRGVVPGGDGGVVVGVGPVLVRDSRDNNFDTRRGGFYQLLVGWHDSAVGSEYDFVDAELDMRRFVPVWRDTTLAFQIFARSTWGAPPFQLQAPLGGKYNLRGYFEGRFRDRHSLTATAEYRVPVWWRLGLVGFGGLGQVAHALDGFDLAAPKAAGGLGFRFSLNPDDRINLRVDAAANAEGGVTLYVHLGEAF